MATTPFPVEIYREYHGKQAPSGTKLPHPAELVRLCIAEHPTRRGWNMGLAYPPESPVFWIKYGPSVVWGECEAQNMAHNGLKQIESSVSAPAVFYACELKLPGDPRSDGFRAKSYVVMEYVPGKTAGQLLEETDDDDERDGIYASIGLALSEMSRIPVPNGSRPAAVNGGLIRHWVFDEAEAPIHYKSAQQLEDHLNTWLGSIWIEKPLRLKDLALEPLIFCYSDLWLGNFMIDEQKRVTVIDFAEASILPSSFLKCAILGNIYKLKRDISDLVTVPSKPGVDNAGAILSCQASMAMSPGCFHDVGEEVQGKGVENDDKKSSTDVFDIKPPEEKPLLDSEGQQITVTFLELHPDYVEKDDASERSLSPDFIQKTLAKMQRRRDELAEEAASSSEIQDA